MKNLKDYLQNIEPLSSYLKRIQTSVYNENTRPKDNMRIWLSYDVEDGYGDLYTSLYELFNELNAESWGNSVATFLWPIDKTPNNSSVAELLVDLLQEKGVLEGESFDDAVWKNTKGLSIYVIYRYYFHDRTKENPKVYNSDHFVLLHNAPIKHIDGWK